MLHHLILKHHFQLIQKILINNYYQEVDLLNIRIDQLKEEKKRHSNLIDIIRRTIPLFSPGKSLFLYSTNLFFLLL